MIIQIRNATDELIESVMQGTGSRTASGAFIQAASMFLSYQQANHELGKNLARLRDENHRLRSIIEAARFAAAQLVDKTSQQDLDI